MSNISHDYTEEYIRGLLPQRKGVILEMEKYALENNVPIIHSEVAQFLRVLIKSHNVKSILEVGTAIGYSASLMAESAIDAGNDCRVVSIERNDEMYNLALQNIKLMGMENNI